ncbi:hypothetical protein BUALT_Bualt01G0106700 [Buddleja alternifolia]|uniref:CCR4-NOT transcription complex subunit 4 n=1 Tax=Buddleja alternifolia TaxID=168488 RepID=A0AAV6YGX6_9LAMI|nr:hypothetical protein BUALT_Bualt01G0106700 [Buddleja alternifolia]
MTSNNEEEKRCPLCAEEMDWTDQQFNPCKCGYQVCVWCWHQIIDMAEKDESEGRCPACRTIYEKEKIVAMQANFERTMIKNSNRKTKPPKSKPKTDEVKKDLSNVRVIQRKMTYVIGLPLSLADEEVLQRKEYFGRYGKVTKVSLSRTAGGAIQQFINDTCSVYITYSKEEEALRCIQSVHGFILEGRLLRASFGTAKYCHAWLKNMPCNNPACLYLHSIGPDEDSFGKDEVAAVHTRSRVQQIVGGTNTVVKRSGNVLPPPADDIYNSTSAFTDKSTIRSVMSDAVHGSVNSMGDITCTLPSKEKEAGMTAPHKMTTFVDIVGRSNSSSPKKDGNSPEDRRILNLSSELSAVTISGDMPAEEPYSVPTLYKGSSCDRNGSGLHQNIPDEPSREDPLLFDNQGSNDASGSSQRAYFHHPSYPEDFSVDRNPVNRYEDEASYPIRCVNSVLNDSTQEMKFQNSAKSDRIYRSSKLFTNEEIVEHLRRIDGDNLTNDEENPALDAVESSIISNIMSIDFDSCEDSLTMPNGLSGVLDESDGSRNSSWNSLNSHQPGYSFAKQNGFPNQMAGFGHLDYGDNKEQFLCKPRYPVSIAQSLAPPGFSAPSRDPPPGFSTRKTTGCLPRASSGSRLVNASSLPSTLLQQSPTGFSNDNVDFFDPAILSCVKSTNGSKFGTRPASSPQLSVFDDESRLWLLMQQSAASTHHDSKFSQTFAPQTQEPNPYMGNGQQEPNYTGHYMGNGQQEPNNTGHYMGNGPQEPDYTGHYMGNGLYGLDNIYGLSSRLADQLQNYDMSSFVQQKYVNGHISNSNGYHLARSG